MNLVETVCFGGSYLERWNDNFKMTVEYTDRDSISVSFVQGHWQPLSRIMPQMPLATQFFPQAASAAVAARRFIASGQTALDLSALAPDHACGAIFAAECMRILMDEYGQSMETVYPYIIPSLSEPLGPKEMEALSSLQPRTCHVLRLLQTQRLSVPPVIHDARLPVFRSPCAAVPTGQEIRLAIHAPQKAFYSATLELFGDEMSLEYPMKEFSDGWELSFTVPEEPTVLWYRFHLKSEQGDHWLCTAPDGYHSWLRSSAHEGFRLTVFRSGFSTPEWFRHAVMYQIFPDRFAFSEDGTAENGIAYHCALGQHPELHQSREEEVRWQPRSFEDDYIPDDFYGGTLKGIREKIPYLKELGITCIYLNPIVEARSNHRYDTSDYLRVDPILGTNEDFSELCKTADQADIRILCDGVFSHTGADSIYFNRDAHYSGSGACQIEASPFDSWYSFQHFPDEYRSWWGFRELPEVNELDPSWQDFVISGDQAVVRRWLRRGASGWRLDVADELPDEVLNLIRRAVKEEKPDGVVLGEVWEDAVLKESYGSRRKYALGDALDSVMNYPFRTSVLDFLHRRITAYDLADFLVSQQLNYPPPLYTSLMNLLGSHDVERLRTNLATEMLFKERSRIDQLKIEADLKEEDYARADRLERLALVIQFSIPGVPSIYYGDELCMTGVNDPFNRRPMPELKETGLRDLIKELSEKRRNHPALYEGDAFFLANDPDVLLILRQTDHEAVLTVINRSDEEKAFHLWLSSKTASGTVPAFGFRQIILNSSFGQVCGR